MTVPGRLTRAAVLARSFAVQGSWNYRTLLGAGFAFALLPALRTLHGKDPARLRDAVARHAGLFNSHPYLAPMALGAVAAMEAAGEEPEVVERFKAAVRGSLGSLADRLVWAGWRPVCLLFSLAVLFAGGAWWAGVLAFLVPYNAGHLALRAWGFRMGLREGKRLGERLRRSPVAQVQRVLAAAGAFLVGLTLPLAVAGAPLGEAGWPGGAEAGLAWGAAAAVAAALGIRFGARIRAPAVLALACFALFGWLIG